MCVCGWEVLLPSFSWPVGVAKVLPYRKSVSSVEATLRVMELTRDMLLVIFFFAGWNVLGKFCFH